MFVYCHTAACTIYLGADKYGVNESCQHDLCRRSTYISFVDGSQTFVLDKEALERHQSTCSLFVFSPSAPTRLRGGAQTRKCRQTLRGVGGLRLRVCSAVFMFLCALHRRQLQAGKLPSPPRCTVQCLQDFTAV